MSGARAVRISLSVARSVRLRCEAVVAYGEEQRSREGENERRREEEKRRRKCRKCQVSGLNVKNVILLCKMLHTSIFRYLLHVCIDGLQYVLMDSLPNYILYSEAL